MRRILFSWNGFNVYSYPAMLYLGLVAGVFAGAHVAQLSGMSPDGFAAAIVVLLIPALLGSRLYFVLVHWDLYRHDINRIWRRSDGGMAMYGGLLMAVPLSIPLLRLMHLPFGPFWDATTFTILVGMVFTRVGCLLNGCCAGRPTSGSFGVNLPDRRGIWQRRIPTQFLEMAWAAILLGAAVLMRGREPFAGAIFCFAVVAYAMGRFVLEKLRDDVASSGDSAIIQVTSVVLVGAALSAIILALLGGADFGG